VLNISNTVILLKRVAQETRYGFVFGIYVAKKQKKNKWTVSVLPSRFPTTFFVNDVSQIIELSRVKSD